MGSLSKKMTPIRCYLARNLNKKLAVEHGAKYCSQRDWQKKRPKAAMNLAFNMRHFLVLD